MDRKTEKCRYLHVVALVLATLIENRSRDTISVTEEEAFKSLGESLKVKILDTA